MILVTKASHFVASVCVFCLEVVTDLTMNMLNWLQME